MNQGVPSTLAPAGAGAHQIAALAWLLIAVASTVCVIVVLLVLGSTRRRGSLASHAAADTGGGTAWIQVGGLLIPTIMLAITFVLSESVLGKLSPSAHAAMRVRAVPATDTTMTIDVTARQWWWQIRYRSPDGMRTFATANEIHLPVGRRVRIVVRSDDVNHSFWIPQLHPKQDAIPGQVNAMVVQADRPGTYRGECSEFCGQGHARMAFTVIAEAPERYATWLAGEAADAPATFSDSLAQRGRTAFLDNACAFCHAVRGTTAVGVVAPDLTHLASRATIAAGTLPNTRQNLEGWIMNAPSIKPGTQMPAFPQLDTPTLRAIVAYLESLR